MHLLMINAVLVLLRMLMFDMIIYAIYLALSGLQYLQ